MHRSSTYQPFLLVLVSVSLLSVITKPAVHVVAASLDEKEIITQIALGGSHSSALSKSGHLFTWGYNGNGQLGDGADANRNVPLSISKSLNLTADETIVGITFGYNHSSALTSNGRFLAWGRNDFGQVGDGTVVGKSAPVDLTSKFNLSSDEKISQVSLGSNHSAVLTSKSRVFLWGYNNYGQLGDNSQTNYLIPTDMTANFNLNVDETIKKIVLGEFDSSALTSTNRVLFWGLNTTGQVGDGSKTNRLTPTDITAKFDLHAGESVVDICPGGGHSSALTSENRLFMWGDNISGQLGDGTMVAKLSPVDITPQFALTAGETITQVLLRGGNSSAITSSARVFTWGNNGFGQLGDGTTVAKSSPVDITSRFDLASGETITQIALGFNHSASLSSKGHLFIWGRNTFGQLGDGTNSDNGTPTLLDIVPPANTDTPTANANWAWWFLLLLLIPIGYLSYRYRKNIANLFKKKKQQ